MQKWSLPARLAARYARMAAVAALLLAVVAAGAFAWRQWRTWRTMHEVPPAVPPAVEQRSLVFSFSSVEGNQTVFTIRARQATRFATRTADLLEDVHIAVYGRRGDRRDEMRASDCRYDATRGIFHCPGQVELTLSGLPRGVTSGERSWIHVVARNVAFQQHDGVATTDAPVEFAFPGGRGHAGGVVYHGRTGQLVLTHAVELELGGRQPSGPPLRVRASEARYVSASSRVSLVGPVQVLRGDEQLQAAAMTLELTAQLQPTRLVATGHPRWNQTNPPERIEAERLVVSFNTHDRLQRLVAEGAVQGALGGQHPGRFSADRVTVSFPTATNRDDGQLEMQGKVDLQLEGRGQSARLIGARLLCAFRWERPSHPQPLACESPLPTQTEWRQGDEIVRLAAPRLGARFCGQGELETLVAEGRVQMERQLPPSPPVRTEADTLEVRFASGAWVSAEATGHVIIRQGQRQGEAQRGIWRRDAGTITLTGAPQVREPSGQLFAEQIVWHEPTGQVDAAGQVQSAFYQWSGPRAQQAPLHVISQRLTADPATGQAVYEGNVRLWQGGLVLQAARVELEQRKSLHAVGGVQVVFPQAATKGQPAVLWTLTAPQMDYDLASDQVTLQGGVVATSANASLRAARMRLTLARGTDQQVRLQQAVATGTVRVQQADRQAEGERAIYDATPGRVVLEGGPPRIRDSLGNTVEGARLTFFLADDTILVESREGSRTVVRHPIPH